MYVVKVLLELLILPPNGLVVLAILGALLWRRRIGRWMVGAALGLYVVLSLPIVAHTLDRGLVSAVKAAAPEELRGAGAIVLLTGGIYPSAPEYEGREAIGGSSLFRARYASWLQKRLNLPILVVGGRVRPTRSSEAAVMAAVLRDEFGVPVRWVVGRGRDTIESARAAREVLKPEGIGQIALVTSPHHMARAQTAFRGVGFDVLPAPTGFGVRDGWGIVDFLPRAGALSKSSRAIKEWLGRLWTWVFVSA